ncbi:outer membrane protein assembly factor BamA [Ostreiculturibacter nitratireducens]|uniref:outer membrane protein assembly factor BamA n=1 Tax=Ostreiculturibacter nitratireducens TaxID=3075226 RepID=UPI003CCC66AD
MYETHARGRLAASLMLTLRLSAVPFVFALSSVATAPAAYAQAYTFSQIQIEGNERVEAATILKYASIPRGQTISAAQLNDAYQRIAGSGLFETVELVPSGGTLVIRVQEYPTINRVSFEGNARIKDEDLAGIVESQSRRVYSPSQAEADAAAITEAYAQSGRLAARVDPRIIRRSDNRVDVVFEIREGRVTEIERLSFTGNRAFSDRRLRQVLETKQAGLLRTFIKADTFVGDRIAFDRQVLTDFYRSRGYVDFQVLGVSSEFSRERDAFFLTFNVQEGQSFKFGKITAVSEYPGVDVAPYEAAIKVREGATYSPAAVDNTISRMEAVALKEGLDFLRVEPRITRNDRDQTLDVAFVLTRGPRIFVERIDIEGNATTLDRVIRRQFRTVEGDPFNPREIREAAERIRALGFFSRADVEAVQGSAQDQVVVDVNVEEQPTGSLSFGVSYGVASGVGFAASFQETNFLGRGQLLSVSIGAGVRSANSNLTFVEPAFLGRDLKFRFSAYYNTSEQDYENYDTRMIGISPAIEFPVSEFGRLELRYKVSEDTMDNYDATDPDANPGGIIDLETQEGSLITSGVGYTYSHDTRRVGLNPNAGVLLRFGQDFNGLGGDVKSVVTTALVSAETKVLNEEVTLRAELEGGALNMLDGQSSRVIDRFTANGKIRGFEPNGIGPVQGDEALGGNYFAVARFEADFPIGLPEEYGISGGAFVDVGSVWGLDVGGADFNSDDMKLRAVAGLSVYWTTPIGPLRFNFSRALQKEDYDKEQRFDLTVSTRF